MTAEPMKAEVIPPKVRITLRRKDNDMEALGFDGLNEIGQMLLTVPQASALIAQLSKAVVEAQRPAAPSGLWQDAKGNLVERVGG